MRQHVVFFVWLMLALIQSDAAAVDYLRDIKPLLQHKCYACHGALQQQGGLRLDTAQLLLKGGDSGPVLIAGQPHDSLLLDVLTGAAGFTMPPANEGSALTDKEIALVREWIAAGAISPGAGEEQPQADPENWWSYRPLQRPPLPELSEADAGWCQNSIDRFIAARRSERQLSHAPQASKEVWLRRVYLDLTGLPPTAREQQQFLADTSESAYETVVDDLLNRPTYGERWARHWMDIWRYSDWYGSRGGNEIRYSQRHIWRWRDWIVESLNADKGYDQMIREMLAADEIAGDDLSVLPATGYLGRSWYKFDRDVWLFESVERTSEAFLGLTLRCCRCHDHKFDPISQEEYYRFRAFFEPHDVRTDLLTAFPEMQKDPTQGQVPKDGVAVVYDRQPDAPTFLFERGDSRYPDKSKPLMPGVPRALGGEVQIQPVKLPATAWYPMLKTIVTDSLKDHVDAQVQAATQSLAAARTTADQAQVALDGFAADAEAGDEAQVLLHDDFSKSRPDTWQVLSGQWEHINGVLVQSTVGHFCTMVTKAPIAGDFQVTLRYRPLKSGTYRSIGFSFDWQDQGNSQDIYTSTNDKRQSVQAFHRVDGQQVYPAPGIVYAPSKVGEETTLNVNVTGSTLTIDLNSKRELDYTMPVSRRDGKFALWVHQGTAEFLELTIAKQRESRETLERRRDDAVRAMAVAEAQLEVAKAEAASYAARLAADQETYLQAASDQQTVLAKAALQAERNLEVLKARAEVAAAVDGSEQHLAATKKLAAAQKAAETLDGTYTALGPMYPKTSTGRRKALAEWIVSSTNPRTSRVAANHLWGRHFGRPLAATPENFGLNGRVPSHPDLLNWLATELVVQNWQMKPVHRQIVLSATYRMASTSPTIDNASLNEPHADPENRFFWRFEPRRMEAEVVRDSTLYLASRLDLTMGGPEIPETEGESQLRRSLYFRNTPNEKMAMLEVFDVADPNACYRRKESIVPHQSLAMMNSGLVLDAAKVLAEKLADESDFVTAAFSTVLSRRPTADEAARCQEFLQTHAQLLQQVSKDRFSAGGTAKRSASEDPVRRAQENLVHVLFLHNDFVTIR